MSLNRLSTDPADPGYVALEFALPVRVFLDGIERTFVITADERLRFIRRACTDAAGRVHFDPATGQLATEDLYGDVRIECAALQPAQGGRGNVD